MAKKKPPAKTRRARGTGAIFYSKSRGKWVGRVQLGRRADGSPHYAERTGDTQKAVIDALAAVAPPGADTTVGQWADRWLAGVGVRPATKVSYENTTTRHIKPALGHLRLRDLTPYQIEAAAKKWAADDPSPNSVRLWLSHLRGCLGAAVRAGVIDRNPATLARRPKGERRRIDPFPPGDLARIIAAATDRPAARIFALLAATGLRLGEAMALDVTDFDRAAGTISVTKTVVEKTGGIGPPKSAAGVRTIRVPSHAIPAVLAAAGKRGAGPLFATAAGARTKRSSATVVWTRLLARLGLPYRNQHQLRHSAATALISDGVPLGDVAKFLGDSVGTVVLNYLHPTGSDPADAMERLLSGRKVEEAAGQNAKAPKNQGKSVGGGDSVL